MTKNEKNFYVDPMIGFYFKPMLQSVYEIDEAALTHDIFRGLTA